LFFFCTEYTNLYLSICLIQIESAEYSFPAWFPNGAKSLIHRILDPNPDKRIRIEEIRNDEWFKKNYEPTREIESEEVNLDDVNAAFDDPEVFMLTLVLELFLERNHCIYMTFCMCYNLQNMLQMKASEWNFSCSR
jgi:hypothetical protein